ncbi:MAG TPA: hypothetical protein GXX28_06045, partial [Firmicutes bacterium]|nr:hypothetical protein [Bacillota bacterium]
AGGQLRYDKASDSWLIRWSDGRPETVVLPVPPKAPAPSPKEPRRKRGRSGR